MKRQCLHTAFILLAALLLCACSHTTPTLVPTPTQGNPQAPITATPSTGASSAPAVVRLSMATGGTGGTYYPYGWALATAIEKSTGYIKVMVNSTGASVENLQQIGNGLADLAIVQNDVLDYAYNSSNLWVANSVHNITTLMSLYPEYCQLIVATDSGIKSVEDLRGKHISSGDIGSGVEINARQILEAHGLTLDDMIDHNLGFNDSAQAMRDKTIDAFFTTSGMPNTAVMALSTERDIRVISLDEDKIDYLLKKYPFYTGVTIEQDTYDFITSPVNTVAVQATLVANPGLEEQVVYDIIKSIIENKDSIRMDHAKGAFISPEYGVQGVNVEFHPGARRYFEEVGAL